MCHLFKILKRRNLYLRWRSSWTWVHFDPASHVPYHDMLCHHSLKRESAKTCWPSPLRCQSRVIKAFVQMSKRTKVTGHKLTNECQAVEPGYNLCKEQSPCFKMTARCERTQVQVRPDASLHYHQQMTADANSYRYCFLHLRLSYLRMIGLRWIFSIFRKQVANSNSSLTQIQDESNFQQRIFRKKNSWRFLTWTWNYQNQDNIWFVNFFMDKVNLDSLLSQYFIKKYLKNDSKHDNALTGCLTLEYDYLDKNQRQRLICKTKYSSEILIRNSVLLQKMW